MGEPRVLPDLEALKELYFNPNTNTNNTEEINVYWKDGTFEFRYDATRNYIRCRQTCHQLKYPAFAKVQDKRAKRGVTWIEREIPHKDFCKPQHACKGVAHCNYADCKFVNKI